MVYAIPAPRIHLLRKPLFLVAFYSRPKHYGERTDQKVVVPMKVLTFFWGCLAGEDGSNQAISLACAIEDPKVYVNLYYPKPVKNKTLVPPCSAGAQNAFAHSRTRLRENVRKCILLKTRIYRCDYLNGVGNCRNRARLSPKNHDGTKISEEGRGKGKRRKTKDARLSLH